MNFSNRWVLAACCDWALIIISALLVMTSWLCLPLAILIIGTRQHALAILLHDGAHRLIATTKRANDMLAWLFAGGPLGVDIEKYREFHFQHHRHLNTMHDPEVKARWELKLHKLPTASALWTDFLFDCLGRSILQSRKILAFTGFWALIGWWIPVLLGSWVFGSDFGWYLVGCWYLSLPTVFYACFKVRTLTEHTESEGTHIIAPTRLERFLFLPHNTWCHHEHHKTPSIPFDRLPMSRVEAAKALHELWKPQGRCGS